MNILFIHGNYPAQFRTLAVELGKQQVHDIRYLTARKDPEKYPISGIKIEKFSEEKQHQPDSLSSESQKIINEQIERGELIQSQMIRLIDSGFIPRLVIFHGGNGLGLFLKQILPNGTLIGYFEWYFSARCAKLILGRDDLATRNFIQTRNLSTEKEILICDACVVPTKWQAKQFPQKLKPYLSVVFDGIDLDFFQPSSPDLFDKSISIEGEHDTILIDQDDILLTYATRGMEPMRGFPEFMKTLPTLLRKLSNLKVIIGGRDRSAYGPACPTHNGSWKDRMLDELPELLNHPRIIYTGLMNYGNYRLMLQRTNLHCYFTKPYVTSWSLFEAAACGAPILSNRSPATNGTLEIPANYLVDQIADVYQEKGLHLIESLLSRKANKERESNIDKDLSREKSKHNWEVLINNALQSQADTRNSYEPGVD